MLKMGIQSHRICLFHMSHSTSGDESLNFQLGRIAVWCKKNMGIAKGLYELNV